MTILWCGGEELDFKGVVKVSTSAFYFDSNYARCAINLGQAGSGSIYTQFTSDTIHNFWFHARFIFYPSYPIDEARIVAFGIFNSQQVKLNISRSNEGSVFRIYLGNTLVAATEQAVINPNVIYRLDIQIQNYDQEDTGTVNVYIDNTLVLTYTGTLYSELIPKLDHMYLLGGTLGSGLRMSEIIIADSDPRNLRLKTLPLNADGDTNQWLLGTYADIDEVSKTVHEYIKTETAGQLFTANISNLPSGLWKIHAIRVAAATSPAYNGLGLKVGIKTNDVVHLGDLTQATWYDTLDELYTVNPETSQDFTKEEVNALQIAIESEEVV
jgi:hypothetical protein